MHKPCNTENILALHEFAESRHGQASKVQTYVFGALACSCSLANRMHVALLVFCLNALYQCGLRSYAPLALLLPCRSALNDAMLL
jgi:hypothetical protein